MVATSTAAAGVHEFTIEHVRVLIDPHDAQAVALALGAGVIPYHADGGGGGLGDAMAWFGRSLVPLNAGLRALGNQQQYRQFQSTVQALDTRTNQVPVCILDLLRIKHTTAARNHSTNGGGTLFGTATLNTSTQPSDVRFSLGGTSVSFGQLHATFTAANSSHPSSALSTLARTLHPHGMVEPPTYGLDDIIADREGDESSLKISKAKTIARYEPDVASIWSITPTFPGHDIIFDTFHREYADTPVYRVFKATPGVFRPTLTPRRTR